MERALSAENARVSLMQFSGVGTGPARAERASRRRSVLWGLICSLGLVSDLHAQEGSAPQDAQEIDSIVVTATKRSQRAEELNGSFTVIDAEALGRSQVRDTSSLARVLPGVQIGYGSSQLFPTISFRGITSAQDFYNPALTFYVDGVPQMPVLAMQALVDVDRVELLRGPQGTLFGKSAQGGIVNIVTRQPGETPFVWLDTGVASYEGHRARGSAGGPLIDGLLYGSVTLLAQSQPGNLRNPATGTDDLGGSRNQAGAARLRFAPDGSPWEVNLNVDRECTRAHQDAYLPFDDYRRRTIWSTGNAPDPKLGRCSHGESLSGSFQAEDWKVTALTSWQHLSYSNFYPWDAYVNWQPERWRQTVQEVRLATQGGERRWDAVFGLYHQEIGQQRNATFSEYVPERGNGAGPYRHGDSQLGTFAAYVDATVRPAPRLNLGAGVRLSRDEARTRFSETRGARLAPGEQPSFSGRASVQRTHVLGQLSAGFQLRPLWDVYVRVAQGYKPTGFNLAPASAQDAVPFGAEDSIDYEIGTRFEQGDFSLQAAIFRIETRNMQLYTGALGSQVITNAGKSRASGVEVDLRWNFLPSWTLSLDGTVTSARFSEFEYSDAVSYTGNRLPFVPRYTAGLHLQGDLDTAIGLIQPSLDVRWIGAQSFDLAGALVQSAYGTFDLNLGWRPTERVQFTAYVLNATNRRYRTFALDSGFGGSIAQANLGRILGLDMRLDWF